PGEGDQRRGVLPGRRPRRPGARRHRPAARLAGGEALPPRPQPEDPRRHGGDPAQRDRAWAAPARAMRFAAVTGRFQPVHHQHLELFALALAEHDHLVVAVTNPDSGARHEAATSTHRHTDAANPFTYFERLRLLRAALDGAGLADRASVVPF